MVVSTDQVTPWLLLVSLVLIGYLLAGLGSWPVCALLLHRYRRQIARGMRPSLPGAPPAAAPPADLSAPAVARTGAETAAPGRVTIRIQSADRPSRDHPLLDRARRHCHRAQVLFIVLGVCFGLGSATVFLVVDPEQRQPWKFLAYALLGSWLIVPTVLALSSRRGRWPWLLWLGYFGVTIPMLYLAGVGAQQLPAATRPIAELVAGVGMPLIFVLATGRRSMRGAVWLVGPVLMMVGAVLNAALVISGGYLLAGNPLDSFGWQVLGAGFGLLVAGTVLVIAIVRLHQAKWLGDQTLLILQWWLVLALWWTLLLSAAGPLGAALGTLPYVVLVGLLLVALGRRVTLSDRFDHAHRPVRLLLLRTFGARERSSRLLQDLTRQWRWIGSVELITAPDLAGETLEPDEFLDFLRGRLRDRFVRDADGLDHRLAHLDLRRDRDGRYRVNELMCADTTWQLALERLAAQTDVILIDLRGFTPQHPGVDHEIQRVVALQPLSRVVAIVDQSTDEVTLRTSLDRAADLAPPTSPLHTDPDPALRVIGWDSARTDAEELMSALAEAAATPHRSAPG